MVVGVLIEDETAPTLGHHQATADEAGQVVRRIGL